MASDFNDPRWTASQFGKQKLSDVRAALKFLEKHDITKYNIQSIAIAKVGSMAAGMMGGKKTNIKPDNFLPFDTKSIQKENGITDESIRVLRLLMKTRRMDGRVIALLADELKSFSGRNQDE